MDCRDIQKMLSAYLDGLLSADEKDSVDRHLSSCAQCRESFEELEKARALLQELEALEPPPWLSNKIMAQVREEAEQKKSFLTRLFPAFPFRVPLQALGVVVLAVLVFQVYRMLEPEMTGMREMPRPLSQVQKEVNQGPNAVLPDQGGKEKVPAVASAPAPVCPSLNEQYRAEVSKEKRLADAVERERAEAPVSPPAAEPATVGGEASVVKEGAPQTLYSPGAEQNMAFSRGQRLEELKQERRQDVPVGAKEEKPQVAAAVRPKAGNEVVGGVAREAVPTVVVRSSDLAAARKAVGEMVTALGGKTIETSEQEGGALIVADVAAARFNELTENMKSLGEVKSSPEVDADAQGPLRVRIEIVQLPIAR